jgi:hypothetical protein
MSGDYKHGVCNLFVSANDAPNQPENGHNCYELDAAEYQKEYNFGFDYFLRVHTFRIPTVWITAQVFPFMVNSKVKVHCVVFKVAFTNVEIPFRIPVPLHACGRQQFIPRAGISTAL